VGEAAGPARLESGGWRCPRGRRARGQRGWGSTPRRWSCAGTRRGATAGTRSQSRTWSRTRSH